MKDFDLDKIGKKMPYAAPSEEFFDRLMEETLDRIEREKQVKKPMVMRNWLRAIAYTLSAAAIIAFVVGSLYSPHKSYEQVINFETEEFYDNLDQYISNLSDDDLSTLLYETENESEFYSNL